MDGVCAESGSESGCGVLLSRGYYEEEEQEEKERWEAVDPEAPVYRALSWPVSVNAGFRDAAQCERRGVPVGLGIMGE